MNNVVYIDQNGKWYHSMKLAPICAQSCASCEMNKVAAAHGKSIYVGNIKDVTGRNYINTRGMNCAHFCDLYPDEVAEAFGYKKVDITLDLAEGVYTTDNYFFKELHKIPNIINDMYIYEIRGENFHKYFLASAKHHARYIVTNPLSSILGHIMPQHYECLVDTELEAIQIAKTVAVTSVIDFAKEQVKTAMEALEKINEESKRVLGTNLKVDNIINNFWDKQHQLYSFFHRINEEEDNYNDNN